jgi:hypothetical protein
MASLESAIPQEVVPGPDDAAAQIRRILESPLFQNSDSSRQLLAFLADWSRTHPGQHVKEYELAISVFHRPAASFDSQIDSVVRVQMARLRAKIHDYYRGPGLHDKVLIDIPKGAYLVTSSYRQANDTEIVKTPEKPEPSLDVAADAAVPMGFWKSSLKRFGGYALVPVTVLGVALGSALTMFVLHVRDNPAAPHLQQFWSQVLGNGAPNLVVFSNPRLAGTLAIEGLRYYREETDSKIPSMENLSYAGAGDAPAAYTLTRLFDSLKQEMKVRSGARLSWDQARESNLIFIDRPEQNPALHRLPRLREFYFKFSTGIVNAHPRPGEQAVYGCSKRPYVQDYAVIAFIPGLRSTLSTLILAGNTTYGSQAAAEFVANDSTVALLLNELGVKPKEKIPYFEVLLNVRINNETPVWSQLIAKRLYPENHNSWDPPSADER